MKRWLTVLLLLQGVASFRRQKRAAAATRPPLYHYFYYYYYYHQALLLLLLLLSIEARLINSHSHYRHKLVVEQNSRWQQPPNPAAAWRAATHCLRCDLCNDPIHRVTQCARRASIYIYTTYTGYMYNKHKTYVYDAAAIIMPPGGYSKPDEVVAFL